MSWSVTASKRVGKEFSGLPESARLALRVLIAEMEISGPYRVNWPHYSPLKGSKNEYHCHLNSGRPTYVSCWRVDKKVKSIEVYYVGTHEKAPY